MTKEKTRRVRIVYDQNPDSPREWDNLGKMVCWHRKYALGDEQPNCSPEKYLENNNINEDNSVILPLYLYDHGGITMKCSSFSCPWDSGQVGFIYVTHEKIAEEYGEANEENIKRAKEYLLGEVETYDQYLTGDVYGFIVEEISECDLGHEHAEVIESCYGFYGSDLEFNGLIDHLDEDLHEMARNAEVEYE